MALWDDKSGLRRCVTRVRHTEKRRLWKRVMTSFPQTGDGRGRHLLRVLNKLAFMPYGVFLISHSQNVEIETRTGKYTKTVPTLPEKARKIVLGLVDMVLYCDIETSAGPDGKLAARRVMRTKPSMYYEAGDRTGKLPEVIDLDYTKFIEAFSAGSDTKTNKEKVTK
jgi:hypothetical protein